MACGDFVVGVGPPPRLAAPLDADGADCLSRCLAAPRRTASGKYLRFAALAVPECRTAAEALDPPSSTPLVGVGQFARQEPEPRRSEITIHSKFSRAGSLAVLDTNEGVGGGGTGRSGEKKQEGLVKLAASQAAKPHDADGLVVIQLEVEF